MEDFKKILGRLGLNVQDLSIYQKAFTHRSYLNEVKGTIESNERLEFLGDSVLSFIVSSFLFRLRTKDEEGDLTNLRAYVVKTESLAKIAEQLSLGKYLKLSRGEEKSGGRLNPQILADTFEAVLGAIFIDLGIEAATTFVNLTLLDFFKKEIEHGAPRDPKSQLQEVVQSQFQVSPKYRILETSGPDHAKRFTSGAFLKGSLIGKGDGSNKQQAEEEAAKEALVKLADMI
ncbi:MAG: ribonuclease III [Armatimonadetes bacterium]|nr:MAG: ribonuclease III [Armatimonadota bacterium]